MSDLLKFLCLKRVYIPIIFVLIAWIIWRIVYPSLTWREELTLYVQTPVGTVSGASVVERAQWFQPAIIPQGIVRGSLVTGEATVVDLGEGKFLFALLGHGDALYAAYKDQLPERKFSNKWLKPYHYAVLKLRGEPPQDVPFDALPRLVTFSDVNDPTSVQLVDPYDLTASFGPGYVLEKVTIGVTRKRRTKGIVASVLDCIKQKVICIPTNYDFPYGHPLQFIPNQMFKGTL